ncbi:sigma-70 family RNA polymerase sigma factor [Pedobacter chinensis]|uniref:Sigma-70 family RNA polymerase sigma factor n=1 Tax=Pedobacter chinensis TaxID=2282421 RepID=A0A369PPC6_9SPHI|nr:sigma-70 family RNA polymerase sigma factor [Pedobacter chinensis]RDC54461.1 sigma-70 family RNA polymerase sigma factor [Pedobacter chinensis]
MSEVVLNIPHGSRKDIRLLYDKYAGMLLGFIRGTVQDHKRSEEYLVKIISAFASETKSSSASWLELRQYAQRKLIELAHINHEHNNGKLNNNEQANNYLNLLDHDERIVFQAVYYQKKSLSQLADLLNRNENTLRGQLKSSIDKIRKARGN